MDIPHVTYYRRDLIIIDTVGAEESVLIREVPSFKMYVRSGVRIREVCFI